MFPSYISYIKKSKCTKILISTLLVQLTSQYFISLLTTELPVKGKLDLQNSKDEVH